MRRFLKSAAFLAVCGIISKVVGALFKVPLTNILGAEGMGIYQLVFPVYTVLLALSSGGLPQAISRMVSRQRAAGDKNGVRRVLIVCLASLAVIGGIGSLLVLALGSAISFAQGNTAAAPAYWALSPSVLFVSVMSVFRGYFQGHKNMFPTALSQLTEQVVKLAAGISISAALLRYGLVSGVAGALVGVSVSEAAALLVTYILYIAHRKRAAATGQPLAAGQMLTAGQPLIAGQPLVAGVTEAAADILPQPVAAITQPAVSHSAGLTNKQILKEIYRTAIPISLSALIMPMSQLIDSVLVVNLLKLAGQSTSAATTLYGIVTAPISTLINLPTVLAGALAVSIIPVLAAGDAKETIGSYMRLTSAAGGAGFVALLVFGDEIMSLLYSGLEPQQLALASNLLKLMSLSVYFISMTMVMAAAMQAKGRARKPAFNLLIGAGVKIALTVVLLLSVGIAGSVIASVACYAVTCALDMLSLKRITGSAYIKQSAPPLLCALAAGAAAYLIKSVLSGVNFWIMVAVAAALFCFIFALSAFLTKSVRRTDFAKK